MALALNSYVNSDTVCLAINFFVFHFMWKFQPSLLGSCVLILWFTGGCKQRAKPAVHWKPIEALFYYHIDIPDCSAWEFWFDEPWCSFTKQRHTCVFWLSNYLVLTDFIMRVTVLVWSHSLSFYESLPCLLFSFRLFLAAVTPLIWHFQLN